MALVSPQRIIAEAINLLDKALIAGVDDEERITNNITELESLGRALYRRGVHKIAEDTQDPENL